MPFKTEPLPASFTIISLLGFIAALLYWNSGKISPPWGFTLALFFVIVFIVLVGANWWVYSFPVITHQLFDHLWDDLSIWLWPYYGWGFESKDIDPWAQWLSALMNNPYIIITEILGIIIIILIFSQIYLKICKNKNYYNNRDTGDYYYNSYFCIF